MVWYDLFGAGVDKGITYAVLAVSFGFILYRTVNITLISLASAVVLIGCGMLEQRGYRIDIRRYLAMSLPFSLGAVLVCHAMIQIFWL